MEQLTSAGAYGWSLGYGSYRIATDGTYVFFACTNVGGTPSQVGNEEIFRVNAANGSAANFSGGTNYLIINTGTAAENICGLCADGTNLWVSNDLTGQVQVYSESTGTQLGSFAITNPQGIATQSGVSGVVWVANGNQVSRYTYPANFSSFTLDTTNSITGLSAPTSLRISGSNLYVIESGLQRVREYSLSNMPPGNAGNYATFGQAAVAGTVTNTGFNGLTGLAVDGSGGVHLGNAGNSRVLHFNAGGTLTRTECESWDPCPAFVSVNGSSTYTVLNGPFEYEVDSQGNQHSGWLGDGTWHLLNHWFDPLFIPAGNPNSLKRTLTVPGVGNCSYFFCLGTNNIAGVSIYKINATGTGFRLAAVVGTQWAGTNNNTLPAVLADWTWSDTSGNGESDFTGTQGVTVGQNQTSPNQLTWLDAGASYLGAGGMYWVDNSGNLYLSYMDKYGTPIDKGAAVKIPLLGFDAQGNPHYDWNYAVVATPPDQTPGGFNASEMVAAPNGDNYLVGDVAGLIPYSAVSVGVNDIRHFDDNGNYLSQLLEPNGLTFTSAYQCDPVAGTGYQFTGLLWGIHVGVWSPDGLLLCHVTAPPLPLGDPYLQVGNGDWYDHGQCMDVYSLTAPRPTRAISIRLMSSGPAWLAIA